MVGKDIMSVHVEETALSIENSSRVFILKT
jgi:hypothetical protein